MTDMEIGVGAVGDVYADDSVWTKAAKSGDTATWHLATDAMETEYNGSLRDNPTDYSEAIQSAMNMCVEVALGVKCEWEEHGHEFPVRQYVSESLKEFFEKNPLPIN